MSPNDRPFNSQEIQNQRHNPNALNEALDAANEKIRRLEDNYAELKDQLKDCHRENRLLKQEKMEAMKENDMLKDELAIERRDNDKLRREAHSRPSSTTSNASLHSAAPRDKVSRRLSTSQSSRPPLAPQAPQNKAPNPFTPLNERSGLPYERPPPQVSYASSTPSTASYAPSSVSYASSNITYAPAPVYSHHSASTARPSSKRASKSYQVQPAEDGEYHRHPI